MRRAVLSILTCVFSSLTSVAQQPVCPPVVLPLTPLAYEAPQGIEWVASDLVLTAKKNPIAVQALSYGKFPRSTVILLDHSASVAEGGRWKLAQQLAILVAKESPNGPVRLATFTGQMSQMADIREGIAAGVTKLRVFGEDVADRRTAIYDALLTALQKMPRLSPEDTIVLITDGGDNRSKAEFEAARTALRHSGVRLVVLLLHDPFPSTPEESSGPIAMYELAEESGGAVLNLPIQSTLARQKATPSDADMDRALSLVRTFYGYFSQSYRLTVARSSTPGKLKITAPKVKKPAILAYPHWISGCPTGSAP